MKNTVLIIILLATGLSSFLTTKSQDFYEPDHFRYENYIYDSTIHTVQLFQTGQPLSMPVVKLQEVTTSLQLSFDDFRDEARDFRFSFTHCNALWEPSKMERSEYINGFNEDYIDDYQFSYNTTQPYIHYQVIFPSEDMKPVLSGNYMLKVYEARQPDKPVLSARFMVVDQKIRISGIVKRATAPQHMNDKQEVDFSLNTQSLYIASPEKDLKVFIQQNDRLDNMVTDIKPYSVQNQMISYDYEDINLFEGGNEFRHLDLKSFKYQSPEIMQLDVLGYENHVYLYPDKVRRFSEYIFTEDINGRYLIKTSEFENSDIEADYAWVHFSLPYEAPLATGSIYIMGDLTGFTLDNRSKMKYDYRKKAYTKSLYLKQGYYEYEYAYLENNATQASLAFIENSFSETDNEYTIWVYYRRPGDKYDQLVGLEKLQYSGN
jgi:hypothetical protein